MAKGLLLRFILLDHFTRYPEMQVQDLYKLLHQAALASEHAVHEERAARFMLYRELSGMGEGPDDPLLDPISPDGKIVRVYLRPYSAAGLDPEALRRAFNRTASEWRGSSKRLRDYCQIALQVVAENLLPVAFQDLTVFISEKEQVGFPAVHHSEVYKRLYRPAYRVIARGFLEDG